MKNSSSYTAPQAHNFNAEVTSSFVLPSPRFKEFFDYALAHDLFSMPLGRYEIDGDKLFFTISQNDLRLEEAAKLESHRQYADIQILIEGRERFGLKNSGACKQINLPYDQLKDIAFFDDKPDSYADLKSGDFIVFMPSDAHAPLIGQGSVKKCVVKVKLD